MIRILNEDNFSEWDDFVLNHRNGTIYHTSQWINIIRNTYDLQPIVIADFQDSIECGIPFFLHNNLLRGKRLISITSAQACNPLVNNLSQLEKLLVFILDFIKKEDIDFAELRTTENFEFKSSKLINKQSEYSTYLLSLDRSYDQIKLNFHKNCIQRPLKKANNFGIKLLRGKDISDIKIFYEFYKTMRKEKGLFPQPFSFFSNLWYFLSEKKLCEVFHASYKGQIISSVFNLKYKDKYTYEYGATNRLFTKYHPSHFLIEHSIQAAIAEGFKTFDFGRTDRSNTGLSDFKRRWGGSKMEFQYFNLPPVSQRSTMFNKKIENIAHIFISHTPNFIYQRIGQYLYKIAF